MVVNVTAAMSEYDHCHGVLVEAFVYYGSAVALSMRLGFGFRRDLLVRRVPSGVSSDFSKLQLPI